MKRLKKRIVSWLTPPRGLHIAGPGKIFFAFMVVIIFLGYISNNNLLFLIFAAMLGLMIVSGMLSEFTIKRITAVRIFPDHIFANAETSVSYRVRNSSRRFTGYLIRVKEKAIWEEVSAPTLVEVPAGKEESATAVVRFPRRGLFELPPFRVTSTFPFNLFIKTKIASGEEPPDEVLVYPALIEQDIPSPQDVRSQGRGGAEVVGQGDSIAFLREYLPGDVLKRIHWKKSAKTGELFSKVLSTEQESKALLIFHDRPLDSPQLETAISLVASLAMGLREEHVPFAFLAPGICLEPSMEYGHLEQIFTYLALYVPGENIPPEPEGEWFKIRVTAEGKVDVEGLPA